MTAAVACEIAFPSKPTETPLWVDVTRFLQSFSLRRGRTSELDQVSTGTARVTLDNTDRRFDPRYTSGPYYPNVKPTRRLRIRGAEDGLATSYDAVVRSDAPVGYWRLGETSGTTAADSSGNGRNGTYAGGPTMAQTGALTGDVDTAVRFIPNDNVEIANNAAFNSWTAFTIECWMKKNSDVNFQQFILKSLNSGTIDYQCLFDNTGKAFGSFRTGGVVKSSPTSNSALALNTWFHYALVYNGSTLALYINGVSQGTPTACTGTVDNNAGELNIGGNDGVSWFDGWIDEVAVYNTALSADRIAAHYGAGTQRGAVEDLYHGYTRGFPQRREGYGDQYVELTAEDGFGVLARAEVNASFAEQASDERIAAVLDAANWRTGDSWRLGISQLGIDTVLGPVGDRELDGGQSDVQASDPAETSALSHLQSVVETENGLLFMGKDGAVVFHSRQRRMAIGYGAPLAVFGDDLAAGELPYVDITWDEGDDRLFTEVRVAREGGTEQTAEDTDARDEHFLRTLRRSTLHTTDGEALDAANYLLARYKEPQLRITGLTLDPEDGTGRLWEHLLERELGDYVEARATPLGGGNRVTQPSFIEAIEIDWTAEGGAWAARWALSAADTQQFWFLGVSQLGINTRLAY